MVVFRWISALFIFFSLTVVKVNSRFEFTNINCTSLDKELLDFNECFLKSVNRTYKYMTMRIKIYKFPVSNVTVRAQVLKRLNGYKPFLFDFTADGCKFFKGKKNKLIQFFYDLYAPYTNINHTCPYNHDVYVEKLPISYLDHRLSIVLPMPEGNYCLNVITSMNAKAIFDLKVYFNIY